MRRFFILLAILFLTILTAHSSNLVSKVYADDSCDPASCPPVDPEHPEIRSNCLSTQINNCTAKLGEAQKQEKTLKSQLNLIDGQMQVTILKIEEATLSIDKLKREISSLETRIDRIGITLDALSEILLKRIVQTYKYNDTVSTFNLIFSSQNFGDLIERLKYIQVAQAYDKQKLYELQATKLAYNDQKQDKQTRQAEAEKLSKELENYKKQLDQQKISKADLLRITQNDEAIYQQKIFAAQQEQMAILAILNGQGKEVSDGHVNKGDIIGHYITFQYNSNGSSPCSGGVHLHFEVHQNNAVQDPNNFLSNTGFSYLDNDGGTDEGAISPHGSWDWPISSPIVITQGYGMTPYARAGAYNGGPHTGLDMWTPPGVTAVKAVRDGTKYTGQLLGICRGGPLNYKRVDHGDGVSSLYLHVL